MTSLPVEPTFRVLLEDEVVEGVAVVLGAWVGGVVGGRVAVPICGALVAPLMTPLVGLTLLGGLVAVSLPKSHALQSTSLLVGAGVGVGVTLGVVSAYYGGWVDAIIMRVTDIFLAFPVMLLAMVITLILGPSLMTICIAIMLVGWPDVARLIRGQALKLKNKDYVRASRALGASGLWIIVKQILPNCLSLIIVSFSMGVPGAIMYEAGMSFFGYGIPAPAPSLGNMISDARGYMTVCPWYILFPGIALVLIVVAFNIFGDGLNDALDPYARRRS